MLRVSFSVFVTSDQFLSSLLRSHPLCDFPAIYKRLHALYAMHRLRCHFPAKSLYGVCDFPAICKRLHAAYAIFPP